MRHRRPQLLRNLRQLLDLLDLGLSLGRLEFLDGVFEEVGVGGVTGVFGDAVVVLSQGAGEGTGREGGQFDWKGKDGRAGDVPFR